MLALLRHHGVAPARLTMEVTESAAMADPARAIEVLRELRDRGVGVSVDDFGTGNASLAYLAQLPANELKIDKAFITNLCEDARAEAIARSTIDLARHLDLHVVAEGIETQAVLEHLIELGCDTGQGYLISRPLTGPDLTAWLMVNAAPPLAARADGCRRRPAQAGAASRLGELAGAPQHRVDHRLGQPAGERVLLAGVVAAQQRVGLPRQLRAVAEAWLRAQRGRVGAARGARAGAAPRPRQSRRGRASTRTLDSSSSSRTLHGRQRSRSAGVGRLAGGAQRTAALIHTSRSCSPSSRRRRRRPGLRSRRARAPRTGSRRSDRR